MQTLFPCIVGFILLSSVHPWRAPTRPTSSVPSWTRLGAEACPLRLRFLLAGLIALPLWTGVPVFADASGSDVTLRIVAMGDVPYQPATDDARFARLIAAVNRAAPDLVLHVGDVKDGHSPCTDDRLVQVRDRFATVDAPLLFTPGDNEWTDCHRSGMDPIERLAALRRLFFAAPGSHGRRRLTAVRQSEATPAATYPENQRTSLGPVMVVTAHVVGSNNNRRPGHPAALAEHRARDVATAAWIRAGFAVARDTGSRALVLAFHADPFTRGNGLPNASNGSGFMATLAALADGAAMFDGPVLVIHGDSHRYRFDRPFRDTAGRPLPNVARLQVFGAPTVAAVAVTVSPTVDPPFRTATIWSDPPEPEADGR